MFVLSLLHSFFVFFFVFFPLMLTESAFCLSSKPVRHLPKVCAAFCKVVVVKYGAVSVQSCPLDASTVVALPSTLEFLCRSCWCDQSDFLHLFQMFSCHHLVEGSFTSLVHCQLFLKILSRLIYPSVCVLIYNLLKQQYISKRFRCPVSIKWLVGLKNLIPNLFLFSHLYHYCLLYFKMPYHSTVGWLKGRQRADSCAHEDVTASSVCLKFLE